MSLKAYNACKMTLESFEYSFLPAIRKYAFDKAKEICGMSMAIVSADEVLQEGKRVYEGYPWGIPFEEFFTEKRQLTWKIRMAMERMRLASVSPLRGEPECVDASFNMWIKNGLVYTMMYGDVLRDFQLPYGVEDYSYWDHCDGPSNVLESEWKRRGELWNLITDEWDMGRLLHEIINVSNNIGTHKIACNFVDASTAWSVVPQKRT